MKAAAFSYERPASVADALRLLSKHADDARILSGGQSLLPAMNLRLATPSVLIDIGRLAELRGICLADDKIAIGALTRLVDLLQSTDIATHLPLLRDAVAHVAHPAIRNRGTVGGNLAHADPASELPACMLALDATLVVRREGSERRIAARDFFKGIYETALAPGELLAWIEIPRPAAGSRHYFEEFARRSGDYAMAGLAATAQVDGGQLKDLRLGFFAVGEKPHVAKMASRLTGVAVDAAVLSAARDALGAELSPLDDQQASPAMRCHLAGVLLVKAVSSLLDRADLAKDLLK